MRVVIQRSRQASVAIGGRTVATIGAGMVILLGVEEGDCGEDIEWLCRKIVSLRIFDDADGVMNRPVTEVEDADILVVSQFTLTASTKKGNRPSYIRAARPKRAVPLYEAFVAQLRQMTGMTVPTGVFGADMQVSLVNDGPVTIIIDSRLRE